MDKEQLYNKVLELRSQDYTYKEISVLTNVSRKTIYDWVKGNVDPKKLKGLKSYKVTDEQFTRYVKESSSIREVLFKATLKPYGGNYRIFYDRIKRLGLDISHFTGQRHLKGQTHNWAKELTVEDTFVENSKTSTCVIRRKILKYNLLSYECAECKIKDWQGQKLSLHIDHINGVNNDNRLENLRFLCPNCHSLTETYCGKNKNSEST